ncbi:hypothetical protein BABINDRAFT_77028 [Babjeviella inositovora NRRL Y-12698]|uniref:DUF590-domain-containing protein n=1 Tax=Babjeviella inositovora NRRL Y-12698 TaxID=984486 RepID=A0A1E3QYP5_9ASCO|nr:uncharacterized protein BABINDRAFT_77028 [Babjeviella inositovora NRRL Y-12698]ODQ82809.1 hypothetical protein BABINDRAFT_77028 [Babjeviella inositovora NRRL Y-12698]
MASSSALPERDTLTQRGAKTSSVGDSTNSNLVSNNHADLDLNPRAGTLADLQPDFVLSVLYSNDNGTVTAAATADFERLLTTLDGLGFQFQVKPGSAQTVLVFIRLAPQALHAAVAAARTHDLAAGVASFTYPAEPSASERLRVARGLITAAGITPGVGNWNFVRCLTALHDTAANYRVLVGWAHGARAFFSATDAQCEHVRDAYGPALALYFYFARHFITWLGPLALVGAANHLLVGRYSPLFALTTLVWSVAFYHSWRQRLQNLTARWGIIGNDATPLPASPSTLADSTSFSDVAVRQLAIVPLALSVTFILFSYQLLCFATEIFLTQVYAGPLQRYLSLIPTGMIVVFVPVLNLFYGKVIDAVCGWEGHTTVEGLRASKAHKQFVVTFLTSYVPLLLSAFLYLPFAHHVGAHLASAQRLVPTLLSTRLGVSITPQFTVNAARLATQYHYFLFTNNVVGFATLFFLPIVVRHALPKAKTLASGEPAVFDDGVDAEYLADVRAQIELRAYDVSEDYTQTVVQFGYLVMYAPVWSLSPLFVLVFALFQFKGDLFKVMTQVRRPLPERVVSSAPYDSYVILLAWVGSITSTAITAMYRVPPKVAYAQPFTANEHTSLYTRGAANVGIAPWKLALVVFAVEHVFFGLNVFFRAVYAHFRPQDAVDLERRVTVARAEFVQAHKRDLVHENVDDSSLDSSWLSAADAAAAAKADYLIRSRLK